MQQILTLGEKLPVHLSTFQSLPYPPLQCTVVNLQLVWGLCCCVLFVVCVYVLLLLLQLSLPSALIKWITRK